ncbi:hypothetical protein SAICODRAFT_30136 [Saitoella complicata NRRL Y-17804]|uniref:uncharacterized protein n=1 Tax=Saitoella complicata (strain BCRC 22490 / CBS 7301 / JCM 7358 / NBRC 10748 / NRRL Y-17804) TaxID=698492 RepID=UPI000867CB93|nr:uncharacterized protein SAICODRAFT_30136 [Saitoella complicata NRRL Y-17804]ODQ53444.1 hypothetical protein SAICODRAFT_30136 [Saitoella complicata NRRL Y-17804]
MAEDGKAQVDQREGLLREAKSKQDALNALLDRIEQVKAEHDKLQVTNQSLNDYIGNLMGSVKSK